jgi:uncharacterized membrane-anchored protein
MKLPLKIVLLIALSVAQVGAAALSIIRHETTLALGTLYKIESAPVDPGDPFRGRYVAIRPAIRLTTPLPSQTETLLSRVGTFRGRGSGLATAYVVLTTGTDGFARASAIVPEAPASGDFLEFSQTDSRLVRVAEEGRPAEFERMIVLPFDRYYMTESAAPAAEERYREASRRNDETKAWITVRVRNGRGVVEGLYIDGVPIEVAARQAR